MKPIKQWLGLGPYDDYEGYQYHWYNRNYEFNGTRVRFIAGDLLAENEVQGGGAHEGPTFTVDLRLCQGDIPEFYLPDKPNAEYDIHYLTVVFWRWGVYLSIRGRVKNG